MQIEFQLFIYFERFLFYFIITISQEKVENKRHNLEAKTTFINDLKNQSKRISPYNTFTLGRVKAFQKKEKD